MNLIDQLVDAAYDTGYYSGKGEDGEPLHNNAILRRERLRHEVLDLVRKQTPEITPALACGASEALVEALRAVEWVMGEDPHSADFDYCPWCKAMKKNGHADNCQRQSLLAAFTLAPARSAGEVPE